MLKQSDLLERIDWDRVLQAERYAGGHEEIMEAIFGGSEYVIASWVEGNWQGEEVFAYCVEDCYVLISDYFGSCSWCDGYEDASDDDIRAQITSIVASSRIFPDKQELIAYCELECKSAECYAMRHADELLPQLRGDTDAQQG